jgi:hypothetical protein
MEALRIMKTISIKYNRETILDEVLKVIEYPCLISIIKMKDNDVYDYKYEYVTNPWGHESISNVKNALYVDDDTKNLLDGLVVIDIFDIDEYVKYVTKKGGVVRSDTRHAYMSASESEIIDYYKKINVK